MIFLLTQMKCARLKGCIVIQSCVSVLITPQLPFLNVLKKVGIIIFRAVLQLEYKKYIELSDLLFFCPPATVVCVQVIHVKTTILNDSHIRLDFNSLLLLGFDSCFFYSVFFFTAWLFLS